MHVACELLPKLRHSFQALLRHDEPLVDLLKRAAAAMRRLVASHQHSAGRCKSLPIGKRLFAIKKSRDEARCQLQVLPILSESRLIS